MANRNLIACALAATLITGCAYHAGSGDYRGYEVMGEQSVRFGVVDTVIEEPVGGAHRDSELAARNLESWIDAALREVRRLKPQTLLNRRYDRLRNYGSFFEATGERPAAAPAPR